MVCRWSVVENNRVLLVDQRASEVRWTYMRPDRQVDVHTATNDDAERVAWLRGDSPSATSEEEVGSCVRPYAFFFTPFKQGGGDFPL